MEGLEEGILDTVPWEKVIFCHNFSMKVIFLHFSGMFLEEENMKWMRKKRKIALMSGGHQGDSSGVHALQQDQHFEDNGSCRLR